MEAAASEEMSEAFAKPNGRPGLRLLWMTHLSVPITSAPHLAQVAIVLVFLERQNISSLPSHCSWTCSPGGPLTEGGACPGQPDTDGHPPPASLGALHMAGPAWPAPGTGLGLPASTSVRGSSRCQARPALADKILISLLRSPEWDPIFMSELGNELHLSSPFSMRKVSRRSG